MHQVGVSGVRGSSNGGRVEGESWTWMTDGSKSPGWRRPDRGKGGIGGQT